MKRAIALLSASLFLTLGPIHHAAARGKKDKEMEPVISKKGKLIFEDDFSEKDLLWQVSNPDLYEWKIVKKTLTMCAKMVPGKNPIISRSFQSVPNAIFELRALVPTNSSLMVMQWMGGQSEPSPHARFGDQGMPVRNWALSLFRGPGLGYENLAVLPVPYRKPRWMTLMYEMMGSRYALTVDGTTIKCEHALPEGRKIGVIAIMAGQGESELFAIDDVKVYEALPLDAPDYKEEKSKGEKADEAKTAKADEAKEEKPTDDKPAAELGNALGKDANGSPIVWDISAKGAMRSADDKGNLTKVTLYGPGQMTTRMKVQTLAIMGKGEVEITAGDKDHAVSLPGEAKIDADGFITLKAKKGSVQITDVKAE